MSDSNPKEPQPTIDATLPLDDNPSPTPADRLTALEEEVASLKDQLLRRRAEFDNYRRRVEREQKAIAEEAAGSLLADLLPSIDALEKAIAAKGTADEIRTGVEITLRDISATLVNRGVTLEDPTGARFDPTRHQALSYEPVEGAEDGTVVACYRKGYILGDRLIRPALVKVAQQASDAEARPVTH